MFLVRAVLERAGELDGSPSSGRRATAARGDQPDARRVSWIRELQRGRRSPRWSATAGLTPDTDHPRMHRAAGRRRRRAAPAPRQGPPPVALRVRRRRRRRRLRELRAHRRPCARRSSRSTATSSTGSPTTTPSRPSSRPSSRSADDRGQAPGRRHRDAGRPRPPLARLLGIRSLGRRYLAGTARLPTRPPANRARPMGRSERRRKPDPPAGSRTIGRMTAFPTASAPSSTTPTSPRSPPSTPTARPARRSSGTRSTATRVVINSAVGRRWPTNLLRDGRGSVARSRTARTATAGSGVTGGASRSRTSPPPRPTSPAWPAAITPTNPRSAGRIATVRAAGADQLPDPDRRRPRAARLTARRMTRVVLLAGGIGGAKLAEGLAGRPRAR